MMYTFLTVNMQMYAERSADKAKSKFDLCWAFAFLTPMISIKKYNSFGPC